MNISPLRQLINGTAWLSIAFIGRATATFGTIAILTRVLSVTDLGFYFLLLQAASIAAMFPRLGTDQGVQIFINEALATAPGSIPSIARRLNLTIAIATGGTLCLFLFGWQTIEALWLPTAGPHLMYYMLGMTTLITAEKSQSSMLRAIGKIPSSAASDGMIRQWALLSALGLLYYKSPAQIPLETVLGAWMASSAAGVFLTCFWYRKALTPYRKIEPTHGPKIQHMIRVSVPLGVASTTATIRGGADILIIGWLMGPEMAGLFGPIKRVTTLVSAMTPVTKMLQPMVAGLYAKNHIKELGELCRKSSMLATIAGLLLVTFFVAVGDTLLAKVFGPSFASQGHVLLILVAGLALRNYLSAAGVLLQMTGQHMLTMRVNILFCLFGIAVIILAAKSGQLFWVACATSGTMVLQFVLLSHLAQRHTGIKTYFTLLAPRCP